MLNHFKGKTYLIITIPFQRVCVDRFLGRILPTSRKYVLVVIDFTLT